jgi:hypothetical protein
MLGLGRTWLGDCGSQWLAAVGLLVVLHCYDLRDRWGVWQGVALVNEDEWRFELYDGEGRRTASGPADALLSLLKQRGLVETTRLCASVFTQCLGRATRC